MVDWYRFNRERTASLFDLVDASAFYERPIPLRHPLIFYEGHIPAFSVNTLNVAALGEPPVNADFQILFERGIDPGSLDEAQRHEHQWPDRETVAAFATQCDERVRAAFESAKLEDSKVPRLVRGQAAYTILEHELMHQETLMYILHQLPFERKRRLSFRHEDRTVSTGEMRNVPAGVATLGADPDAIAFGWDNEFLRTQEHVGAFDVAAYPVTNGDWLGYVEQGGAVPEFWRRRDGAWLLRLQFEEIALPLSWPVYVTHRQAEEYARSMGMRLPTEAEYHRAAFGTPAGEERAFPWGNQRPAPNHGNFGFERFDPEPVDAHPDGASAWGIFDLIGNGWEWTATPFAPFPGFEPMASYPQYSADFFDGKHYVMKGASPVTPRELVRRSLRNWFYADYPYMYAKFRCVG
ncbi:MAG TPA: SUMF1/EgtB/PvdO family nonheme iron enzyme [Candidatus Cybelea sp.]